MICTRPDLTFTISTLSRYISNPGLKHWEALKWMLRYFKGISDACLKFCANKERVKLKYFVDADYAEDRDNLFLCVYFV